MSAFPCLDGCCSAHVLWIRHTLYQASFGIRPSSLDSGPNWHRESDPRNSHFHDVRHVAHMVRERTASLTVIGTSQLRVDARQGILIRWYVACLGPEITLKACNWILVV
jgi:hypothetical protein